MSQTEATAQKLNNHKPLTPIVPDTPPVKIALLNTFLAAGTVRNLVKETCRRTITTQQAEAFLDLFKEELQTTIDGAVRQTITRHFKEIEASSETSDKY